MSVAMLCLLGLPAVAHADYIAPNLAPGSAYRLIFVTSDSITATSSDEATYNSFVNEEASQNSSLPTTTWTAITSTESQSAVGNVDTVCSTEACLNAPIYLVDGTTLIAANQASLFGGTLNTSIYETQSGGQPSSSYIWTGSTTDGQINSGNALGDSGAEIGNLSFTNGSGFYTDILAFAFGWDFSASASLPVLAISGELTVPSSVPEPASSLLLLTSLAGTGLVLRRRRGNRQTPQALATPANCV